MYSVMSDSLRPHGLQSTKFLCPWDFPGKSTRVGCHFLLQGIFLTQGSNPSLLCPQHWQVDSLPLGPPQPIQTYLGYSLPSLCQWRAQRSCPRKNVPQIWARQTWACIHSLNKSTEQFTVSLKLCSYIDKKLDPPAPHQLFL